MASITPNKKDGKIVSYKFRACVARDELGKQIFKCTTWKIPSGMTPSKAEKAAQKAALQWEKKIREEYQKDLIEPERIKLRQIQGTKTEFSEFVWKWWFPICIDNGTHKHTTIDFYKHTTGNFGAFQRKHHAQFLRPV